MCGIVGYSGGKNCVGIIMEGLKKLEYRGYDSAGIAFEETQGLDVLKAVGRVENLEKLVKSHKVKSNCAIAHTRWATHGKPCVVNSHPHSDCKGEVAIVHNGIIENYAELKAALSKKGHKFASETDSEIIAHLIEEELKKQKDFFKAFASAVKKLKGAYALAAAYKNAPGVICAAKKQSPLVIGKGEGEYYLASDVPAFLNYTNKAIFLEDGDLAEITPSSCKVFNLSGVKQNRKVNVIKWSPSAAQKGGYKHFMIKEIFDQPQATKDTISTLPADIKKAFGITPAAAKRIKGLYIVACGTAYHAALCAKYVIEHFAKLPVEVETASEFKYRSINFQKNWLFIAVSQSGETADTLAALMNAKKAGLKTLSICNVVGSTITRASDYTVYTHCGPEISVASTKAFTSQLAVLYSFALHMARQHGVLSKTEFEKLYKEFQTLPELISQTLKGEAQIEKLAKEVYKSNSYIFLGRNASFPIALEGALKLKEISYLHAEGFAGGEIKHGPIAIIDKGLPVVALSPKGPLYEKMISSCQEVSARGAKVIIVSNTETKGAVLVPYSNEYLFPILAVIPLQLLAYHISDLRGREIDRPRNLAKSVTVE